MATRKTGFTKTRSKSQKNRPKHGDYIHKSLYQKRGDFGLSTFSKDDIPAGTVIIKETPHNLPNEPNGDEYKFKLIKRLLKTQKKQFIDLVPTELDEFTPFNYKEFEHIHHKYFPELDKKTFKLYLMKYKRNAFNFENKPGILFFATKLNHSCNPNVTYSKNGKQMWFKTTRPIKANDEVFDSYISTSLPREERQETLLRRYGFKCGCEKCSSESIVKPPK